MGQTLSWMLHTGLGPPTTEVLYPKQDEASPLPPEVYHYNGKRVDQLSAWGL